MTASCLWFYLTGSVKAGRTLNITWIQPTTTQPTLSEAFHSSLFFFCLFFGFFLFCRRQKSLKCTHISLTWSLFVNIFFRIVLGKNVSFKSGLIEFQDITKLVICDTFHLNFFFKLNNFHVVSVVHSAMFWPQFCHQVMWGMIALIHNTSHIFLNSFLRISHASRKCCKHHCDFVIFLTPENWEQTLA